MVDDFLSWPSLVVQHLCWYPLMEPRDVYKLLFQGVMGAEHLISSPEQFSLYLATEFASLQPDPDGRLFEPVRPDQTLLRLNLCVYKSHYSQVTDLLPLLLETGQVSPGDVITLKSAWSEVVAVCMQGLIPGLHPTEMEAFTAWLEALGFPAVHHSQVYRQLYRPAYRLIARQPALKIGFKHAG